MVALVANPDSTSAFLVCSQVHFAGQMGVPGGVGTSAPRGAWAHQADVRPVMAYFLGTVLGAVVPQLLSFCLENSQLSELA